ncbi:hypothetical protein [Paraburkholderia bryophila]|jgi:hypothetical protein|uniref:Uncharacterized protein n=1 Tax=Paraburkholderia bryophila TaxID=420952 RepID=A0A329CAY1_9BURK|nr:hypothetical protein [Paraburkholderia bryophila]RAS31963.1 hypothetical protein BX591_10868 [Paraburkholderia bryophila]
MLYLKNTLGGLSRSLTDSALNSFQGPYRWWKLALFAVLFVLPGGSVGVAVLAWVEHRRARKGGKLTAVKLLGAPASAASVVRAAMSAGTPGSTLQPGNVVAAAGPCLARGDAPCRAAAGKQARQTKSVESRV